MSREVYKVAENGQVSLPAQIRRDWDLSHGGYISLLDGKDAIGIIPAGYEYPLVEAIYPQSELTERAANAAKSGMADYAASIIKPITESFVRKTRVSQSGQFVMGGEVQKRWNMKSGGHINVFDAHNTVFARPTGDKSDLGISLPMDILLEDWQAKVSKDLLPFYSYAYGEWCTSIGHSFVRRALDNSEPAPLGLEANDASRTHFGQILGKSVVQRAFSCAAMK